MTSCKWVWVGILMSTTAQAFTLLLANDGKSPTLGWKKHEVIFDYNPTDCPSEDALTELIDRAAGVWNAVSTSSLTIKRGSKVDETLNTVEHENHPAANPIILCSKNLGSLSQAVLGYASNFKMDGDGVIQFSFLVLNNVADSQANIFGKDNETAVTAHEMGHVLGVGHSQDNTALMYYTADSKAKGSLAQDDIDAISYLYASNEPSRGKLLGCGSMDMGGGSGPANWFLVFILSLGAVRWRRSVRLARSTP